MRCLLDGAHMVTTYNDDHLQHHGGDGATHDTFIDIDNSQRPSICRGIMRLMQRPTASYNTYIFRPPWVSSRFHDTDFIYGWSKDWSIAPHLIDCTFSVPEFPSGAPVVGHVDGWRESSLTKETDEDQASGTLWTFIYRYA